MKSTFVAMFFFFLSCSFLWAPPLAVLSIPKCGTTLAKKCMTLLTGKMGFWFREENIDSSNIDWEQTFLLAHWAHTKNNLHIINAHAIRSILIVRDPRDQIISFAWFCKVMLMEQVGEMTIADIAMKLIVDTGTFLEFAYSGSYLVHFSKLTGLEFSELADVGGWYSHYLPWQDSSLVRMVRFEMLVGPQGGGSKTEQVAEVAHIMRHIGLPVDFDKARAVADSLFGGTSTFREGQIGSWKKYFTEEHKNAFKKVAGQLLIDLGYETGFDW